MPLPITTGGIIPEEPPPFMSTRTYGYRGPGGSRNPRSAPGSGLDELQAPGMGSRFEAEPLPTEAPSAVDLESRIRSRSLLDEAYAGQGGYDPKLATLEEGEKDAAVQGQKYNALLDSPVDPMKAPPPMTWREDRVQRMQKQKEQELLHSLQSIGSDDDAQLKAQMAELMADPEYVALPAEGQQSRLRQLKGAIAEANTAEERRILAAASIGAGKGLPTTAFAR